MIQKIGKSVAAIVDINLFEKKSFDALCEALASKHKGVETKLVEDDLLEAVKAARRHA